MVYLLEARQQPSDKWTAASVFDSETLARHEVELSDFMYSEWRILKFPMNDSLLGTRNVVWQGLTSGDLEDGC